MGGGCNPVRAGLVGGPVAAVVAEAAPVGAHIPVTLHTGPSGGGRVGVEAMVLVAGAAIAPGAVRVETAHRAPLPAGIPQAIEAKVIDLHPGAVAAGAIRFRTGLLRARDPGCPGMGRQVEALGLQLMATGAVLRGDQGGDPDPLVHEGIGLVPAGTVAIETGHIAGGVCGAQPVLEQVGSALLVAHQALAFHIPDPGVVRGNGWCTRCR